MARRSPWNAIPNTEVEHRYELVQRGDVLILCVSLRGYAENSANGVSAVKEGLDAIPATLDPTPTVSTLESRGFANASDDACAILTSVFEGTPCCWVYHSPEEQQDHSRWDLPPRERLASSRAAAIDRVVAWKRAGGFVITYSNGSIVQSTRWTPRGCVVRSPEGDDWQIEDLFHRNRMVERRINDEHDTLVQLPAIDAIGTDNLAARIGARLLRKRGRIVECDFSPWQTRAPIPEDWVQRIAALDSLESLCFGDARPRVDDVLVALGAHPTITEVAFWSNTMSALDLQRIRDRGVRVRG